MPIMIMLLLIWACGSDRKAIEERASVSSCPDLVETALETADAACDTVGSNQVCYGNIRVDAEPQTAGENFVFAAPGDRVGVEQLLTLRLSPMDVEAGEWGVALMWLRANLPEALPGQNVTMVLYGHVELMPATNEAVGTEQAFVFSSGVGDAPCASAPDSGILVQTSGSETVTLQINGVNLEFSSTAYLSAQSNSDFTITTIEGLVTVEAQNVRQVAVAGTRVRVPMDANLQPSGPPEPPEPYLILDVRPLGAPASLLPQHIALGPDQIAFISNRDDPDPVSLDIYEIYVMNADGSNQRRLTFDGATNFYPAWSPDGRRMAFSSDLSGSQNIYVMDADGRNLRQLTDFSGPEATAPSWSPDGTRITFAVGRHFSLGGIYVMDADGSNLSRLTESTDEGYSHPTWSPDGKQIAFSSDRDMTANDLNREIYVMNADGSNQRRLTNTVDWEEDPVWSPDGTRIVFQVSTAIYVMNADGSNYQRLSGDMNYDYRPVWSPDGTQIIFVSNRDGNPEIYVMNADGSNLHNLTNNPDYVDSNPAR